MAFIYSEVRFQSYVPVSCLIYWPVNLFLMTQPKNLYQLPMVETFCYESFSGSLQFVGFVCLNNHGAAVGWRDTWNLLQKKKPGSGLSKWQNSKILLVRIELKHAVKIVLQINGFAIKTKQVGIGGWVMTVILSNSKYQQIKCLLTLNQNNTVLDNYLMAKLNSIKY